MKKLLSIIFILGLFALVGCNSDKSKIRKAATSFFTALNHKNIPAAKAYATKESADFLDVMQQQITELNEPSANADEKFLISDIQVNGNTATASVRSETQQTPLHVTLKKTGNDWKVAFDKNTIMGMAQDMGLHNSPDSMPSSDPAPADPNLPSLEPTRRDTQVLQLPR